VSPELIALARSGDEQATGAFISSFLHRVEPLARSFARSSGIDVDDLLQDVAVRMWRFREKVLWAEKPVAYSRVLARNAMINCYRRRVRERSLVSALVFERSGVELF